MQDAQLCATVSVRLVCLLLETAADGEAGRSRTTLRDAVSVSRTALQQLSEARGQQILRLAQSGICGAPSISTATVLQRAGGPAPYSSATDMLQHTYACLHADLLSLFFRAALHFLSEMAKSLLKPLRMSPKGTRIIQLH